MNQRSGGRRRKLLQIAAGLLLAVSVLVAIGATYESIREAADERAYPAPGKLVDVDGHQMHINCSGNGSPTVVISAGLADGTRAESRRACWHGPSTGVRLEVRERVSRHAHAET